MTECLLAVFLAVVQIAVRTIGIAGMIWQEWVHARSNCAQMRTASASGVVLYESRKNGTTLLIVPQRAVSQGRGTVTARSGLEEAPGS